MLGLITPEAEDLIYLNNFSLGALNSRLESLIAIKDKLRKDKRDSKLTSKLDHNKKSDRRSDLQTYTKFGMNYFN